MNDSGAKWLVIVATLLVAAVGVWWFLGDERRILKELEKIEQAVSKTGPEAELEAFSRSRAVADALADPFEVRAEAFGFGSSDRRAVMGQIHLYRNQSKTIDAKSFDHEITVQGNRATSFVSFALSGDFGTREMAREVYRFRMEWVKSDGWKIAEVELLETEGADRWGF